jgi:hypothetical protein
MADHGWIERIVRTLLVSEAQVDREKWAEEVRQRIASAQLRFETLLRLVNAQTIESSALDVALSATLAGLVALIVPLFERAESAVATTAVGLMIIPALLLAYGLFGIRTATPRAILVEKLVTEDLQSITGAARTVLRGYELNREKLGGKRVLHRLAIQIFALLIFLWAVPMAWRFVLG